MPWNGLLAAQPASDAVLGDLQLGAEALAGPSALGDEGLEIVSGH